MNETLRVPAAHSREGCGLYSCAKWRGRAIPPSWMGIDFTVGIAHVSAEPKG